MIFESHPLLAQGAVILLLPKAPLPFPLPEPDMGRNLEYHKTRE